MKEKGVEHKPLGQKMFFCVQHTLCVLLQDLAYSVGGEHFVLRCGGNLGNMVE